MRTPGIADPYWFEWYVGLQYIVDMLNPDNGIECVIFQHPEYDTIDDVVVEYKDNRKQICYQIKHEISTSTKHNLTFSKLFEMDPQKPTKKCLLESIMCGWNAATNHRTKPIMPVLYTNRSMGTNHTQRNYKGKKYTAYPIGKFFELLRENLLKIKDGDAPQFSDKNLNLQWEEMCDLLNISDVKKAVPFFKEFTIKGNQNGLEDVEESMISNVASYLSCDEILAVDLLSKLVFALRKWTTSMRDDIRVTIEDVYSALSIEGDINDSQHRLAPPYPFFESRKTFCEKLEKEISSTAKNIVFISGEPGSGKTSTISYLQSYYSFFTLRYHTFRPISPEQHFYNIDAGMYSSEILWGTLLIQLRQKFMGKIAKYNVPVNNKLLTVEKMRDNVLRLLGILAIEAEEQNKRIYVCIDGIDHAARAKNDVSFLSSLPTPDELPEGVCFIIVGQPSHMYQTQYPVWLSNNQNVEYIDMPKLCSNDIKQLILEKAPLLQANADGLADYIYQCTDGNNLSTVFAVEEIKNESLVDDAIAKLKESNITYDVQQYYTHIWNHAKTEIFKMNLPATYPESIIACPILLMNGRIKTSILARALPYEISESEWKMILSKLHPLIVRGDTDGEYSIFHNDFRVFLMGIICGYEERYNEIALALADDIANNEEGLMPYIMTIPLLQCAKRTDLIPKYFNTEFVVNALAEGVSRERLDEFAHLSYDSACSNCNIEGYIDTYLAVKSLHQHIRYYEYYQKEYLPNDYPELSTLDIAEIRTLPLENNNLDEYRKVLSLCQKLYRTGTPESISRSSVLYKKWFDNLSLCSFTTLCEERVSEEEYWHLNTDEVGLFIMEWGQVVAEINADLPITGMPKTKLQDYAITLWGDSYFKACVNLGKIDRAVNSIKKCHISQQCFTEKLEDVLYGGNALKVKPYLEKVSINPEKPSLSLLSRAMLVMCDCNADYELDALVSKRNTKRIYDEESFTIVLNAFLLGHIERHMDDAIICDHVKSCYSHIDEKEPVLTEIRQLSRFACLLGKYYWDSNAYKSDVFVRFTNIFLTYKFHRNFDYSKARIFLLYALLQSTAGFSLANSNDFFDALKSYLFEIEHLGMYYKKHILDYLQKHDRLDIIKEYISKLYGQNCCEISIHEDKKSMHNNFEPYGKLVFPEMMQMFNKQLKWDVIGYMGDKEYAMQNLSEYFEFIISENPCFWSSEGLRLYSQSRIAEISNNSYSYDIRNNLIKAATQCSLNDFWKLQYWDDEFRINPDAIYHSLFELIHTAKNINDLTAVWLICCGINSWYTQEERYSVKNIYEACVNKSQELSLNFNDIVANVTPQWLTIINHEENRKTPSSEYDDYSIKRQEEIKIIQLEFEAASFEEIQPMLSNIPILSHPETRFMAFVNKAKADGKFTEEVSQRLIESICTYLCGKEWPYHQLDDMITCLLESTGDDGFWKLAKVIGNNLSDYDYQTSVRNMQLLIKLFYSNNLDSLKELFDKELSAQESWVSGNDHIYVDRKLQMESRRFGTPENFEQFALFVLLEQIESQNSRKIEAAMFAIQILGKQFELVRDKIALEWFGFSNIQKDYLLLVISRWVHEDIPLNSLKDVLIKEYEECNLLSRKYYLHSILLYTGIQNVLPDSISCNAETQNYILPQSGTMDNGSLYEGFLYITEQYTSTNIPDGIRRFVAQHPANDTYVVDPYTTRNDIRIPVLNPVVDNILYCEENQGTWRNVHLSIKKSGLCPVEDAFILTDMPQIVYDEDWFPTINPTTYASEHVELVDKKHFSKIARMRLRENELLLSTCIWYPWGYNDGTIYRETTKIFPRMQLSYDNEFDWCLGNLGILAYEGPLYEMKDSFDSINLFNRTARIRIHFGNAQMVPSSVWKELFNCAPSNNTPYIWVNDSNEKVLWLERFASPVREAMGEPYIRQPILFRWVCNKEWVENKLNSLGLRMGYISSTEQYK